MFDPVLNELIGGIYDAAIEPQRWPLALDAIRRHFLFENAMLAIFRIPSYEPVIQVSCNIPGEHLATLPSYTEEIGELWGGAAGVARYPLEEPILHSQTDNWARAVEGRHFLEWAAPQGLVDQVVVFLANSATMSANVSLGIHRERPRLTDAEFDALRLITPHLRRAATIGRLLDVAAGATVTFRAALDAMNCGAVLVDEMLGIVHANQVAGAMLRRGDPIRSVAGRLELLRETVPGRLETAVRTAASGEAALGRAGLGIPARRADDSAIAVHVMPLERRSSRVRISPNAVAAVFIADAALEPADFAEAASQLYGLTPAEARVFELVAAGHTSGEMASELGIAPSTVRTHLLRVFDKTGRHRRADLVRLAAEIRAPV